jgi:hypothetical protein
MSRRRPFRQQRVPIFVGCEGESERGYVAFLGRLAEQAGLACISTLWCCSQAAAIPSRLFSLR